jgi:hypothetical protein
MHGASAPQVQRSARQRLAELHDPALRTVAVRLKKNDLGAAKLVIDKTIDYVPPPQPNSPKHDFTRLTDDERGLFTYLLRKLEGSEPPDPKHVAQRLQLTFGPWQWAKTQPDSDQLYRVREIRFEQVPNPPDVEEPK